ncbi:MAG TPA: extracellular solute-binding protein, partial [Pseudomonadales bacterium]|nr:extracellular solute-binding protein [Pseudomonadales bacterium]
VNKMRGEDLLHEIDKTKLNNFKNLDPKLLNQSYDPDNKYSVPYMWGVTGIMVNSKVIDPAKITSWNDLWNPEFKGQLLMQNDVREVFHAALKVLGYSGNTTNPAEIEAAFKKLQTLVPNVRIFNSEKPSVPFIDGEVNIGMIWNGEAYMAAKENPDFKFIYPKEGVAIWIDNIVIPKHAKNIENAHKLIDYLLRPEVAKAISEEIGYASPNLEAVKLLPKEIRENRTAYPAAEDIKNGEMQLDVGPTIKLYEEYWDKLKAQK